MPDFTPKQTFPMAEVINAAQQNAALQQRAREQGNQSLIEGLQSIGQVGQSIVDHRRQIAQSLAIGRQTGVPDEVSKTMTPEQLLNLNTANKWARKAEFSGIDMGSVGTMLKALTGGGGQGQPAAPASGTPAPQAPAIPTSSPATAAPTGATFASQTTTTPVPDAAPPIAGLTPPTTDAMPTPIQPPIQAPPPKAKTMNPATFNATMKLANMYKQMQPQAVVSSDDALAQGTVAPGTHILKPSGSDAMEPGSPAYIKNQEKLEQQYTTLKARALSNRSGGLGLEDQKVNMGIHLRQAINQYYNPKTGEYTIPPSAHTELALGVARMMSGTGQIPIQLEEQIRQKTVREGVGNALIALGFDPQEVGGTTQSVGRFFVKQVDRQALTAEQNRQGYMDYIHGQAPVDLDPERIAKHDKQGLNSFSKVLAESPDQAPTGHALWSDDKEKRYQELKKRQSSNLKL